MRAPASPAPEGMHMKGTDSAGTAGNTFRKHEIGLWAIEYDGSNPPRMYADETLSSLLNLPESASPEEIFTIWYTGICENQKEDFNRALEQMKAGMPSEVKLTWTPASGNRKLCLRLNGSRDEASQNIIRLEGTLQNISNLVKVQNGTLSQNISFSNYILNSFSAIFYVNLKTLEFEVYKKDKVYERDYSHFMNYREAMDMYIANDVHPEDRPALSQASDTEYIRKTLKAERDFSVLFRRMTKKRELFMRFQVIKGYDEDHVVFGFSDIDDMIQQEKDKENLITMLSKDYECVIYVKFRESAFDDTAVKYRVSDTFSQALPGWKDETNFADMMEILKDTIVIPEDREKFQTQVNRAFILKQLHDAPFYSINLRMNLGGTIKYYQMRFTPYFSGKKLTSLITGLRSIDDEVMEQRRNEERISQQVRNYELLQDAINSGMWFVNYNPDGSIQNLIWSKAFRRMTGYTDELEYPANLDNWKKLIHPEDRDKIQDAIDQAISSTQDSLHFDERYRLNTKDRGYRWFRATAGITRRDDGSVLQVFGAFIDITDAIAVENMQKERIKALEMQINLEKQLSTEKMHMTMFHDIIHSGMWSLEYDGNRNIQSVYWSNEFRHLLGFTSEEDFPNRLSSLWDVMHPHDKTKTATKLMACFSDPHYKSHFEADFRLLNAEKGFLWFHASGRLSHDKETGTNSCYGTLVDTTDQHNMTEMNGVIQGLSEDFSFVCSIDVHTNEEHVYRSDSRYINLLPGGEYIHDFTTRMKLVTETLVHPEDRQMFYEGTKKTKVLEELEKAPVYTIKYRYLIKGEIEYWQAKFIRSKNNRYQLIVGFNNNDLEMKKEMMEREKLQQNLSIIEALSSEYTSVFYINLNTEEITPYAMNQDTENAFGKTFNKSMKYSTAFAMYADFFISAKDRVRMTNAGSIENIKLKLKTMKSFEVVYENFRDRYCKMKIVKAGDSEEPEYIALGFADKDDQLRSEMEAKQVAEIATFLSRDFDMIYYVDTTDDTYMELKQRNIKSNLNIITSGKNFFSESLANLKGLLHPDDLPQIEQFLAKEKLLSSLVAGRFLSVEYRLVIAGKSVYFQTKVLKPTTDSNYIIIAVANIDAEVSQRQQNQRELEKNLHIISVLASEYSSVFYIDLKTDNITQCTVNTGTESRLGTIFNSSTSYSEAYRQFVKQMVYKIDRKSMYRTGTVATLKRQLKKKKSIVRTFRAEENGAPHYCELKYVKVGKEDETPEAVVLAIADKDEELLNKYVDSQLYRDYSAIYMVNLENDEIRAVMTSKDKKLRKYNSFGKYSIWMGDFPAIVTEEFKEMWTNIRDVSYVRSLLKEQDTREYTFKVIDGTWTRCVFRVIDRKRGRIPKTMVVSFTLLDSASSEKLELDAKISEQKKELEKQQALLETALKNAEAANKAKTTFLSNMSHDIRTPINAIIGYTDLSLHNINKPEQIPDYLTKTKISSQHLLGLIDDVLDMSRIESGKLKIEGICCTIPEIMHELNTLLLGQTHTKQLHFTMNCSNITDEYVVCDKLRLHRVLLNLLSNAVKFTPSGGNIHVSAAQLSKETNPQDGETAIYEFRVKDDGIGISSQFLPRLFEPFERERTSTVSGIQGTGLGMSITKGIITQMNGTIDVQSEPNKGTEFRIRLPLKLQKNPPVLKTDRKYRNCKALIIDSDCNTCADAASLCAKLGLKPEWTIHSHDAINLAQAEAAGGTPYSIFLISNNMPDMKAVDLIRSLKEHSAGKDDVFAVMTYDMANTEEELKSEKNVSFIQKPVFLSTLQSLLSNGRKGPASDRKTDRLPELKGMKILLVEDNELNMEIAKSILEIEGMIIDTAENGKIAVSKVMNAAPGTYDFVIMDVQMPEMNGLDATRAIRNLPDKEQASIKIIAMTANAFEEDRKACLDAGMDDYVTKPIIMNKLKAVLAEHLPD